MKKIFSLLGLLMLFCSGTWGAVTPVSEDFSGATLEGWSGSVSGRNTPTLATDDGGNQYMASNGGQYNGSTVTGTTIVGSVAASTSLEESDDFTLLFDIVLRGGNGGSAQYATFTVNDANNSNPILKLRQAANYNVGTWTINDDEKQQVTLSNNAWYNVKVTKKDGNIYLTITSKSDNSVVFERAKIAALSTVGGLGKIVYGTGRYYSNLYMDNIVVRAIQSGDAPAGPAYSIRYMLGSTVVKTESGEAPVGEKLTSKDVFWENNVKYFATNGVQEFTNTANPADNVFDVAVRQAQEYKWSVVSNNVTLITGTGIEGENVTAAYPQFYLDGTTIYETVKTNDSKKQYNITFALNENNKVATVASSMPISSWINIQN